MDFLKLLLTNSKFWAAFMLLVNTILLWAVPDFPPTIWAAIDALVAVIIGAMAANDSITRARQMK